MESEGGYGGLCEFPLRSESEAVEEWMIEELESESDAVESDMKC